jgi:hypothetical protein
MYAFIMCPYHLPVGKTKDLGLYEKRMGKGFQTPPFHLKGRINPHEKCHFFLNTDFLGN